MSKRILIVGAGPNQIGMVRKARKMGLLAIAMDGNQDAPGLNVADVAVVGDICDPDEVVRAASTHRVDGVYSAAEWSVEAVASAASTLGLPGVPPEVAHRVRNKLAMREALSAAGVPTPDFRGVRELNEAESAAEAIGLPVIVKPADGNASRGVRRVDHPEEVSLAFNQARKRTRSGLVLVEAFMEGEEYNVDGLMWRGDYIVGGLTGKDRSDPPHRFDLGIHMPPLVDDATQQAIIDMTSTGLQAVGYTDGTTHVEVIITPEGPRIVEIAGRPGGGRIPTDLIPLTYGMDFMADAFRVALGEPPCEERKWIRGAAVHWIPSRSGIVTEIAGEDEARAVPGVEDVVVTVTVGTTLGHVVDCASRDAVGYVMASGDNAQEAIETATRAAEAIQLTTTQTTSEG
ncbi:MAG: ATP-grasp domain-containing protein [bacterium]|nr:ATP-grasp domain-containing protein [bacterium]